MDDRPNAARERLPRGVRAVAQRAERRDQRLLPPAPSSGRTYSPSTISRTNRAAGAPMDLAVQLILHGDEPYVRPLPTLR